MIILSIFIATAITVLFFGYSEMISGRAGELSSVSASTYWLPQDERWKFPATLGIMGLLNFYFIIYLGAWAFLASACIIFAGVTIRHAEPPAKIPHTVGTVGSIVFTYLGFIFEYNVWLPSILLVAAIAIIVFGKIKNKIWKIEEAGMAFAWLGYLIMLLS